MYSVQDILKLSNLHEFVDWCNARGKQFSPNAFPWRFLLDSDSEFMQRKLTYQNGTEIPFAEKQKLLKVVRSQAELVLEYYGEFLEEGEIQPKVLVGGTGSGVQNPPTPNPPSPRIGQQGTFF